MEHRSYLLVAYLVLENQTNLFREYLLVKYLSVAGLLLATLLLFRGTLDVLGSRVLHYTRGG